MRILFLSPRQCWPARGGAKLREYHFLRALAQRGEVTYVHFTDSGADPLTLKDLPFCKEVVAVPKPPAYGAAKLIQGVLGRWPLPILNYTSAEMSGALDRLTGDRLKGEASYEMIHLDSIHMMRYGRAMARGRSAVKLIYNWHNIESEAMLRYSDTLSPGGRRWYARLTASKLARMERDILQNDFGHVVCSSREKEALERISPSAHIAVVENGVDVAAFSARAAQAKSQPLNKLIFVGLMDYSANVDAATSFTHRIWPSLREKFPQMTLWIVGATPAPAVVALGSLPGVTVTGTVPDVRPYYSDALAAIVPLRTGGGTRLKILEAMAAGVPVVSTPLGAEGLAVTPDTDLLFADPDSPDAWIKALGQLEPGARRESLTAAGLSVVRTKYDWETLGRKLCDVYSGWLGRE